MNLTPEWVSAGCAVIAVVVSIIALLKSNDASNKVNTIISRTDNESRIGKQRIKGDNNKTATGSGNTIS